ncbi:MAG TPA: universal stress protein [Stellaceae bacterium]|nr:universal stress protein [Stellaceae bacterium]
MSDVVLVVLNRPEQAPFLLDAAAELRQLAGGGRVQVLPLQAPSPLLATADSGLMDEALQIIITEGKDRRQALRGVYDQWVARGTIDGVQSHWIDAAGPCVTDVEQHGRRADYIVIGRPCPDDDASDRQGFRAALFRTERPLLVVPPGGSGGFGRRIAVLWRDDGRAIKALLPAIRLFGHAERIDLLAGVRPKSPEPKLPPALAEHGIKAELHVLEIGSGAFARTLLDRATKLGADLLVMGAYAHNPLKDLILGGVTRDILAWAELPVLMRH